LAVVFSSSFIIGESSGYFGVEVAEPDFFPIKADIGAPATFSLVKTNSDKTRRRVFSFSFVAVILGAGRQTEIFPAVIEAVVIFMVNQKAGRRFHNLPVHTDNFCCFISRYKMPDGIKAIIFLFCEPVEITKPAEILLVNYRKSALT
jgi:hypothetical protein